MSKKFLEIPLNWFVCPITKERFYQKNSFLCSSLKCFKKNKKYGFWDFMPKNAKDLNKPIWKIWEKLQANAMVIYTNDPVHNLGVGKRKDFLEFAKFCNFKGVILDVGVGPQKNPTHMAFCRKKNVFFVGLDSLVGEQPRPFAFVRGLAEYLPFRSKLFDMILFITTLDHFINPSIALKEAKRVLKNDGTICIWTGEKNKNTPRLKKSPKWYKKIKIPTGAEDQFHFKRFSSEQLEKCFDKIGFKIKNKKEINIDKWRKNLFYKITKK